LETVAQQAAHPGATAAQAGLVLLALTVRPRAARADQVVSVQVFSLAGLAVLALEVVITLSGETVETAQQLTAEKAATQYTAAVAGPAYLRLVMMQETQAIIPAEAEEVPYQTAILARLVPLVQQVL
jgi:hypothetical protein